MKLRFYIFKRLRNILRKRRIYRISLSLSMIITLFFSTLIYFSFNDYFNTLKEPILVSNSENSSALYNDVLQDKVEKYRELYAKEYDEVSLNDFDDYKQPTQTNIKFIVDEIYDINELNSTFMASGYIEALWDDSAIQRFDLDDNEDIIHKMSRRDILSTSNLSFYDSENQLYEKVNLINGDKESSFYSNFSKYRFKGRFRMERDMRRFPFDRSILKIRLNHALKAPDVFLWSDTDSVIIDPSYRINSYN